MNRVKNTKKSQYRKVSSKKKNSKVKKIKNKPTGEKGLQRWIKILQFDLEEKDTALEKLQNEFEARTKWNLSLDKELKQKNQQISKLQKDFHERSKWASSIDTESKKKTSDTTSSTASASYTRETKTATACQGRTIPPSVTSRATATSAAPNPSRS